MYIHTLYSNIEIIISIQLQSKSDSRILPIFRGLRAMVGRKRGWRCVFVSHGRSLSSQFLLSNAPSPSPQPILHFSLSRGIRPEATRSAGTTDNEIKTSSR